VCICNPSISFVRFFNSPGAAGKQGLHKVRTIIRFVIDGSEMKDAEVIELGPR
jgi:hypothetical protein